MEAVRTVGVGRGGADAPTPRKRCSEAELLEDRSCCARCRNSPVGEEDRTGTTRPVGTGTPDGPRCGLRARELLPVEPWVLLPNWRRREMSSREREARLPGDAARAAYDSEAEPWGSTPETRGRRPIIRAA